MNTSLGIVLPMGQNRKRLIESGQWSLWESELTTYRKAFSNVELFEYRNCDWRRFVEALIFPLVERTRFKRCSVLKAVHLTGAMPCLIARLLYGIPYVLSYGYRYDEFAKIDHKWFQWVMVKLLTPIAILCASTVMISTHELERFVKKCGAKRTVLIPNGVDTEVFKGPASVAQGRALCDLCILFVGRLEKQKNLEVLIQAVHMLCKGPASLTQGRALRNVRLSFVGDGTLKQKLIALARELQIDLTIESPVSNSQLPRIYQETDIFVLPSLAEGHPKVLLEAMSCGIPCLASAIPGTTEIITHGRDGWLVEPTVMGIARGLDRLIRDRELRLRLGTEARKTVETRFNKKKLMEKECKLLTRF